MPSLEALVEALRVAGEIRSVPAALPDIRAIEDDSRRVGPGTLFCAVEGSVQDGHAYVPDAVARGAAVVVVTREVDAAVPQIVVRDGRRALALIASTWFGHPAEKLDVIGVTGTNGKTTTVALIRHLLNGEGRAASVGTLGAVDGAGRGLETLGNLTTPGVLGLQAALAELRARGVTTVALEASSHALDQRRLETLTFSAAVYTNLTHEHLDYHLSLESYRDAKMRLSTLIGSGGVEIVNADDPAWEGLPSRADVRRVAYGTAVPADVRATDVTLHPQGTTARFVFRDRSLRVRLPLLGDFNVVNALAAAAAAWALGSEPEGLVTRLATAPQVPGRLEKIVAGDWLVLRDYAHTPDALARAIGALRPITAGRLIVLFGAGGDRDRAKRPLMGRVVAGAADLGIVTSDNPRTEDPDRIIDEIEDGMAGTPHLRITDRRQAIVHALGLLEPGDCLLLAGKGHETYQVIGTASLPFDEPEIVRDALAGGAIG
jgi:UDP-N-acetylmuramoyl-L-alanyl-D-glutamate--2,6-diaminopimelate ligase